MRHSKFTLFFSDNTHMVVWAMSMYQAVVTGQCTRINEEKDFTIEVILDENGKRFNIDSQMSFKLDRNYETRRIN